VPERRDLADVVEVFQFGQRLAPRGTLSADGGPGS
jgi:hypothetical protein